MCDSIIHRGPDDEGIYTDGSFGFGMRRLSIIDIASGHQPIFANNGNLAIVFNGEIYNYRNVKRTLEAKGHQFTTNSDTETILIAYKEWGDEFLPHLNGMFAIAIWDKQNDKLLLARDRLGVKPLYYFLNEDQLVFGSEIKAIFSDPSVPRVLNPEALSLYLSLTYVPNPFSMVQDIWKLEPGHKLISEKGKVTITKYWDVRFSPEERSKENFREEFLDLFNDAVKIRMLSEVPLGAFLSGGIDSSAVVAFMSKNSEIPVRTFSIGMKEGGPHDETEYALQIAKQFGTDHTVFKVGSEMLSMMNDYVTHFDEPFADYAALPTFIVSKLAKEHVTVVLTGDGGDEVFAGYNRYRYEYFADIYQKVPRIIRRGALANSFNRISHLVPINSAPNLLLRGLAQRSIEADEDPALRYFERFRIFKSKEQRALLRMTNIEDRYLSIMNRYWIKSNDRLANRLNTDIHVSLPEDMLTKVDRVTMAVSLEARSPFLDYRIIELAAKIPSEYKLKGLEIKHFLKYAFKGILPDNILYRAKHGFGTPLDKWLREDLAKLVHDTLNEEKITDQGVLNFSYVREMIENHYSNKAHNGHKLFMLMVFTLWMEKWNIQID